MNLVRILPGSTVFIDTNLLIYSRRAKSQEAIRLLRSCAASLVQGVITTIVVAEYAHRMMMIECKEMGIADTNPARTMSERPALVRSLSSYADDVRQILNGGLHCEPVLPGDFLAALEIQSQFGLLTNDSLNLAVARRLGIKEFATADPNFDQVQGLVIYKPADIA
ncbi:MAG: type II toxin-antitoxin system VapC family toxin [Terrimicrobiaceae bacterium]